MNLDLEEAFHEAMELDKMLPDCVVSGGFWRDTLLGRPYKDIDVIINTQAMPVDARPDPACIPNYEDGQVVDIQRLGDVQIIRAHRLVRAREQNIYNDCGICAVSWSLKEGLVISPRFISDLTNRTLTFIRKPSPARLARLTSLFPDYKVIL